MNFIIERLNKSLGVEKKLNEIALLNMWPEIVGNMFKNKSKALSVMKKGGYDVILVSVANSVVSQELYLHKRDIVNKLFKTGKSLNLDIRDVIFTPKFWNEDKKPTETAKKTGKVIHHFIKTPIEADLKDIEISEDVIKSINESLDKQEFLTAEQRKNVEKTIINDIKTQIWKKNNGFPICAKCAIPSELL
ncbi:MAG: DUF721 domain-containing protein [Ignavibacteriales bacterium]|nr:DUF721 domain-containing protein [Ignavibacteriales bacterium]